MKFTITKNSLEKAMAQIDAIVPGRDTQTLLSNVLLTVQDNVLRITASDMESTVRISLDTEDSENGELICKAKKLSEIARQIQSESVVFQADIDEEAKESDDGTVYRIKLEGTGKLAAKFKMAGSDRSHFPEMNDIASELLSTISADVLGEMISKTVYSISQEDNRYIYNGLYFNSNEATFTIVGTDGRRLAAISRDLSEPIAMDEEVGDIVVHAKAVRELMKIIGESNDVLIGVDQRDIFFRVGNAELSSRLLEGKFPDYKKVIPPESDIKIDVSRDDLINSLKQVMVMTEQPSYQVKLTITSSALLFSANTPEVGEAEISIPVTVTTEEIQIGFNANYLMDILKSINGEKVLLKITDPAKPIVVEDLNDSKFVALVMPMKI